MADPAISVTGLVKSYDGRPAVAGIDFEVARGEVVAMLGPNGAGKTTTVEILEGYRDRDAGEVRVLGFDPERRERALRARVGIVLQECAVEPYLTVREVLTQRAALYVRPRDVAATIDLVGLDEKADARVKRLSGGQQRRLDLALALIGDPEVIFLDEPTTGFDPSARRESWDVVRGLCAGGTTVLLTTHYMDEAQALADRLIVLAHGRIVASGAPETIGGRRQGRTAVRFTMPGGVDVADLPIAGADAADAGVHVEGRDVEIDVAEPTALLHRLTGWSIGRGEVLEALRVERPSLEDIYLSLTSERAAGAGEPEVEVEAEEARR